MIENYKGWDITLNWDIKDYLERDTTISNLILFIIFLIIKYHCKKNFYSNYLKKFNIIKN